MYDSVSLSLYLETIVVIKRDMENRETWRYSGRVLRRREHEIQIEAIFNREDMQVNGLQINKGDRFVETFFSDRWYNVFEIYDSKDREFKGLYCNVSCPAEFTDGAISYIDLALDLLVYPDGTQRVLDKEEFDQLPLPSEIKAKAEAALGELKSYAAAVADSLDVD